MSDKDYTVLVVDDEKAVLQLMDIHLSQLPYTIIPTSSPAEAIHILRSRDISVLVCDLNLNMPNMDGNVILSAARESNPDIVSILISGIADHEDTVRAINEGGIWKYMNKPWNKEQLVSLVTSAVERYKKVCEQSGQLRTLARNLTARVNTDGPAEPRKRIRVVRRSQDSSKGSPPIQKGDLLAHRYELDDLVGEGGLGQVYRAQDLMLQMPVAVKVLSPELSDDHTAIMTLKEEARIAMQLSHKHIVRLHNLQKARGRYYMVMEYVEGMTFREILDLYGRLSRDSVAQLMRVSSDAISYAHRHGVIHKDLKPDNFLLTEDGVLKIIDFGIACLAHSQKSSDPIIGTPSYMSPEHIRGETLDVRTDVYALGIMAYEFLTGAQPFQGNMPLLEILDKMPPELDSADINDSTREILKKATAFRRSNRWETVPSFATALIDVLSADLNEEKSVLPA